MIEKLTEVTVRDQSHLKELLSVCEGKNNSIKCCFNLITKQLLLLNILFPNLGLLQLREELERHL